MTNQQGNDGRDRALPGAVQYSLGFSSEHGRDVLWRCDALRAGRLYSRTMFGSREEAEAFAKKLMKADPDHIFNVEEIKASTVWN